MEFVCLSIFPSRLYSDSLVSHGIRDNKNVYFFHPESFLFTCEFLVSIYQDRLSTSREEYTVRDKLLEVDRTESVRGSVRVKYRLL